MGNIYGYGDKAKATKLHSELVRTVGYCEACFRLPPQVQLQCAHIQGRKSSATRTLLINACCLCASCHRIFTDKPLNFSRWITGTWIQEYRDMLIQLSNTPTKVNWTDRFAELKEYKKELENGTSLQELRAKEAENL